MKVLCTSISGGSIPANSLREGESEITSFTPLRIGESYTVYGLMFSVNRIDFFVCPDNNGPCWMPSNLFTVTDSELPSWKFSQTQETEGFEPLIKLGIVAIVGYEKLTSSYEHYVGVLERVRKHLDEFYLVKEAIDCPVQRPNS